MDEFLEWLRHLSNVTSAERFVLSNTFQRYALELIDGRAVSVLRIDPAQYVAVELVAQWVNDQHGAVLVVIDGSYPQSAVLDWDKKDYFALIHALFFGRVYRWQAGGLHAEHYQDSDYGKKQVQHCPADSWNPVSLKLSEAHTCYNGQLPGMYVTVGFGEPKRWWTKVEDSQTYTAGSGSRYQTWQEESYRQRPPEPHFTEAEWERLLEEMRAQFEAAQRDTQPPPRRSRRTYLQDAYAVLGLTPPVSQEQIKAAYRKKARETHPDTGGSHEQFLLVQQAYETLKS